MFFVGVQVLRYAPGKKHCFGFYAKHKTVLKLAGKSSPISSRGKMVMPQKVKFLFRVVLERPEVDSDGSVLGLINWATAQGHGFSAGQRK